MFDWIMQKVYMKTSWFECGEVRLGSHKTNFDEPGFAFSSENITFIVDQNGKMHLQTNNCEKLQLAQDLLNDTLDPDTEMKLKLLGVLK